MGWQGRSASQGIFDSPSFSGENFGLPVCRYHGRSRQKVSEEIMVIAFLYVKIYNTSPHQHSGLLTFCTAPYPSHKGPASGNLPSSSHQMQPLGSGVAAFTCRMASFCPGFIIISTLDSLASIMTPLLNQTGDQVWVNVHNVLSSKLALLVHLPMEPSSSI